VLDSWGGEMGGLIAREVSVDESWASRARGGLWAQNMASILFINPRADMSQLMVVLNYTLSLLE
jgi:hypothetical protein